MNCEEFGLVASDLGLKYKATSLLTPTPVNQDNFKDVEVIVKGLTSTLGCI